MTAAEIAETLLNGNIAQARHEMTHEADGGWGCMYDGAALALAVVDELAYHYRDGEYPGDDTAPHVVALNKVRRCLEGAP